MKKEIILFGLFAAFCGGIYLIWNNVEGLALKIILIIVFSLILLFVKNVLKNRYGISDGNCPFLNDSRLMSEHNLNPDIWYNNNFCSVSDYGNEYEVVGGATRTVSNTNKFYSCCTNGGTDCPVFEQYSKLNIDELLDYYQKRKLSRS
jgi:hypothetical protein